MSFDAVPLDLPIRRVDRQLSIDSPAAEPVDLLQPVREMTMSQLSRHNFAAPALPASSVSSRVQQSLDEDRREHAEADEVAAFYAAQAESLPAYRSYGAARKARRRKQR
jgi:hypothetical protein